MRSGPRFTRKPLLAGLLLGGPAERHHLNRQDAAGHGTFSQVMWAVRLLEKYHAAFHILCVATGKNARSVEKIDRFFRKQGLRRLQVIPCIEPLEQQRGRVRYHRPAESYGEFLTRLFDLWCA